MLIFANVNICYFFIIQSAVPLGISIAMQKFFVMYLANEYRDVQEIILY